MATRRKAQTRRQAVNREIEREGAILEARLAHPTVRAMIGEALAFAREAHKRTREAGFSGAGGWNEMEPGARPDPYGLWHSVSQALGVSFLVHPDRNGEPTVATALERRVCYAAVGKPDENDPAKPLGPKPLGDASAVRLTSGSSPFEKRVEVAVNLGRSDRELRAAFDRMTVEEITLAVPIYRDLSDGFTLAKAARRSRIGRKAAERLVLRLLAQDEEFQLPKIQRAVRGRVERARPERGYCAECPDGRCAGCDLAAAVAEEEVPLREKLFTDQRIATMRDAINLREYDANQIKG
jgi:hypothetical protein